MNDLTRPFRAARVLGSAAAVLVLSVVVVVGSASPAGAHGLGGLKPTDYQTRLTGITPAVPGLTLEVVDIGTRLRLTNRTGEDVTVLGYEGEPYLRVGPNGVYENLRSPALYLNKSLTLNGYTPPKQADAKAAPEWRKVSDGTTVSWHDHRAHFMGTHDPPAVARDRSHSHVIDHFDVAMEKGGQAVTAHGEIVWVPPPSPWPMVLVAIVLAAVVVALSRTTRWRQVFATTLIVLCVSEMLHAVGLWNGSTANAGTKLVQSAYSIGGILLALAALAWMRWRGADAATPVVLIAAIFLFVAGGLADVTSLGNSQIPSSFSPAFARALVVVNLGLGAGLAAAAAWRLRPQSTRAPARRAHAPVRVTS